MSEGQNKNDTILVAVPRIGNVQAAICTVGAGPLRRPVIRGIGRVGTDDPKKPWEMEEIVALRDLLERCITTAYDIQSTVPRPVVEGEEAEDA